MDKAMLERLLKEMVQIRRYLAIIAQDKIVIYNENISKTYLTTESRIRMYDLFDGLHSYKDIAEEVGNITSEAVRQFAVLLEKNGIVEYVIDGNSRFPRRIF